MANEKFKAAVIQKAKENPFTSFVTAGLTGRYFEDDDKEVIEALSKSLEKFDKPYFDKKRNDTETEYKREEERLRKNYLSKLSDIDIEMKDLSDGKVALKGGNLKKYAEIYFDKG